MYVGGEESGQSMSLIAMKLKYSSYVDIMTVLTCLPSYSVHQLASFSQLDSNNVLTNMSEKLFLSFPYRGLIVSVICTALLLFSRYCYCINSPQRHEYTATYQGWLLF